MNWFRNARRALLLGLARRLPPCEEVTQLISASMDRRLSVRERLTMRLHLLGCLWCARYLAQLRLIRQALHHHAAHGFDEAASLSDALSDEARARIKRTLEDA